jgi:hypothetical protein
MVVVRAEGFGEVDVFLRPIQERRRRLVLHISLQNSG